MIIPKKWPKQIHKLFPPGRNAHRIEGSNGSRGRGFPGDVGHVYTKSEFLAHSL